MNERVPAFLTLRDYFAARAVNMQIFAGMLAMEVTKQTGGNVTMDVSPETLAANAYSVADAMLRVRGDV